MQLVRSVAKFLPQLWHRFGDIWGVKENKILPWVIIQENSQMSSWQTNSLGFLLARLKKYVYKLLRKGIYMCHVDCFMLCYCGKSLDLGTSKEFVLEYSLVLRRRILKRIGNCCFLWETQVRGKRKWELQALKQTKKMVWQEGYHQKA